MFSLQALSAVALLLEEENALKNLDCLSLEVSLHGLVTSMNTMKYGKYIWDYIRHGAIWEDWSTVEIQNDLAKEA